MLGGASSELNGHSTSHRAKFAASSQPLQRPFATLNVTSSNLLPESKTWTSGSVLDLYSKIVNDRPPIDTMPPADPGRVAVLLEVAHVLLAHGIRDAARLVGVGPGLQEALVDAILELVGPEVAPAFGCAARHAVLRRRHRRVELAGAVEPARADAHVAREDLVRVGVVALA